MLNCPHCGQPMPTSVEEPSIDGVKTIKDYQFVEQYMFETDYTYVGYKIVKWLCVDEPNVGRVAYLYRDTVKDIMWFGLPNYCKNFEECMLVLGATKVSTN